MGAETKFAELDASLTSKEVTEEFEDWQETDALERGNSYSGGWNMLTGLRFLGGEYEGDAFDLIDKLAEKWGPGVAFKWKKEIRTLTKRPTYLNGRYNGSMGYVGRDRLAAAGWKTELTDEFVFFYEPDSGKWLVADQLTKAQSESLQKKLIELTKATKDLLATSEELHKVEVAIRNPEAEFKASDLIKPRREWIKAKRKLDKVREAVQKQNDKLAPKFYEDKVEYKVVWLVGGIAAC